MDKSEIEQMVKEIVALQFGIDIHDLMDDTNFVADLNADSLDAVEVVMGVEDRFDLTISDEDSDSMMTVGAVVRYVEKAIADKSGE